MKLFFHCFSFTMKNKIAIILLCLNLLAGTILGATTKERNRKKKAGKERDNSADADVNICDIEQTHAPIFCYCNANPFQEVEEANCLIFRTFEATDTIWDHFSSQPNIQRLTFTVKNDGYINYVPTPILRHFSRLYTLSFQYAKFNAIESKAFADLPTVSTINLNKNNIFSIKWHAFERLANLTVLNLDDNYIAELNRDQFYDVPRMQKLFINHNNLSILHENAFRHLPSLQELELNNNKITQLSRESFLGLHVLQRLDLHNNLITKLNDRVFYELPDLQEVDLDQNKIDYISEKAFDGMKNLRKLRISDNRLMELEKDFLVGAPAINLLDLRHNQLRVIIFDNIKPVVSNFYTNSSSFHLEGEC